METKEENVEVKNISQTQVEEKAEAENKKLKRKKNKNKEKTKERSTNVIYMPLMFIAFSLLFEFVNFIYFGFLDSNGNKILFPTYFMFDIAIIFMLAGFLFLMQKKRAIYIFFYIFLFIHFVFNLINTTMYKIFGDILSVDMLKLGAEATTAITVDFIDWVGVAINLGLFGLMVVCSALLIKFNKKTYTVKYFSTPIIALAGFILAQSTGVGVFQLQQAILPEAQAYENEIEASDKYLWNNFQFKTDAFKKFGHFGFYAKTILNLVDSFIGKEIDPEPYIDYIDEGYVPANPDAPLYGDNLVVILCESMDLFAIDPIYTPTLWKIYNGYNSYVLTNFYARNRTNISEGIVINGSMPKDFLLKAYGDGCEFQYSLPHVFEAVDPENTVTTYMHPNNESFYGRNVSHTDKQIGFDDFLSIEDYPGQQKFKWEKWITDLDFTSQLMDKMLPTDGSRFLTFFSSLSTHGPYSFERENLKSHYEIYDQHFDQFKKWMEEETDFTMPTNKTDLNYLRCFKAGMIDFDDTIENLLNELDKRGLAENTSILLFADHNAYYHDLNYKMRGLEKTDFADTYANKIPVMLYSPHLLKEQGHTEGQFIDTFTNTYDLLPTICDIYGLPSNSNLYQGYSIFSKDIDKSFFSSHLSGMFNDKLFSTNISDIYIADESATEEDIKKFKENAIRFYEKQKIIDIVYKNGINGKIKLV